MDFYYRSLKNGWCEVVCTRCLLTLGAAIGTADIWDLEKAHHCDCTRPVAPLAARFRRFVSDANYEEAGAAAPAKPNPWRAICLVTVAVMLLYTLPTLFEFAALRHVSPWFATVLPGDLAGCVCLMVCFRKTGAGLGLYLLLTAIDACLYGLELMPPQLIPWLTDAIPTLVVTAMLWRSPLLRPARVSYS